ncbi:MAG: hypothetical protein K0T99_04835 [Alphaproteobacteria bacterium]|nr:hypothetical protein [Alphaproteobacteria bacterium]
MDPEDSDQDDRANNSAWDESNLKASPKKLKKARDESQHQSMIYAGDDGDDDGDNDDDEEEEDIDSLKFPITTIPARTSTPEAAAPAAAAAAATDFSNNNQEEETGGSEGDEDEEGEEEGGDDSSTSVPESILPPVAQHTSGSGGGDHNNDGDEDGEDSSASQPPQVPLAGRSTRFARPPQEPPAPPARPAPPAPPAPTETNRGLAVVRRVASHFSPTRIAESLSIGSAITLAFFYLSNGMSYQAVIAMLMASGFIVHITRERIFIGRRNPDRPPLLTRGSSQDVMHSTSRGVATGAQVVSWCVSGGAALVTVFFAGGGALTFTVALLTSNRIINNMLARYLSSLSNDKLIRVKDIFRQIGLSIENKFLLEIIKNWLRRASKSKYPPPSRPAEAVLRRQLQDRGIDYLSLFVALITLGATYSNFDMAEISAATGLSFAVVRTAMRLYLYLMERARVALIMDDFDNRGVSDPDAIAEVLVRNLHLATRFGDRLADFAVMINRTGNVIKFFPLALIIRILPDRARNIIAGVIGPATVAAAMQWRIAAEAVRDRDIAPENVINYVADRSPVNRLLRTLIYILPFLIALVVGYFLIKEFLEVSTETLAPSVIIGGLAFIGVMSAIIYRYIAHIDNACLTGLPCLKKSDKCMVLCGHSEGHTGAELRAEAEANARRATLQADLQERERRRRRSRVRQERERGGPANQISNINLPRPSMAQRARRFFSRRGTRLSAAAAAAAAAANNADAEDDESPFEGFSLIPTRLEDGVGHYRLGDASGNIVQNDVLEVRMNHQIPGRLTVIHSGGFRREIYPGGLQEVHHPEQSQGFLVIHPDGRQEIRTSTVHQPTQTVVDISPLGSSESNNSTNSSESEETAPNDQDANLEEGHRGVLARSFGGLLDYASAATGIGSLLNNALGSEDRAQSAAAAAPAANGMVTIDIDEVLDDNDYDDADDDYDDDADDESSEAGSTNSGSSSNSSANQFWSLFPPLEANFSDKFEDGTPEILDLLSGFAISFDDPEKETSVDEEADQENRVTARIIGKEDEQEYDDYDEEEEWRGKKHKKQEKNKLIDLAMPEDGVSETLSIHPKTYEHFTRDDDVTRSGWLEDRRDVEMNESTVLLAPIHGKHMPLPSSQLHHAPMVAMPSFHSHHHAPLHLKAPSLAGGMHSAFHLAGIHSG